MLALYLKGREEEKYRGIYIPVQRGFKVAFRGLKASFFDSSPL